MSSEVVQGCVFTLSECFLGDMKVKKTAAVVIQCQITSRMHETFSHVVTEKDLKIFQHLH